MIADRTIAARLSAAIFETLESSKDFQYTGKNGIVKLVKISDCTIVDCKTGEDTYEYFIEVFQNKRPYLNLEQRAAMRQVVVEAVVRFIDLNLIESLKIKSYCGEGIGSETITIK